MYQNSFRNCECLDESISHITQQDLKGIWILINAI